MSPLLKTPPALVAALALALAACGDDDEDENPGAQFTLTLTGLGGDDSQGFNGNHAGESMVVAVVREDNGAIVARQTGTVAPLGGDPAFRFTFPQVLAPGVTYHVDYRVDHLANGTCDPPPAELAPGASTDGFDHIWRLQLAPVTADFETTVDHSTVYLSTGCDTTR
jgi:hypothetical protein